MKRTFLGCLLLFLFAGSISLFAKEFRWLPEKEKEKKDKWERVFLATYPRSGNHWMRYLIEEATHVATSSVYRDRDPKHLPKVFPWGGFCADHGYKGDCRYPKKGDTVIIKTHYPAHFIKEYDKNPYKKVIRIVRHPVDSFYSFYVHRYGELPEGERIPRETLKVFVKKWKVFEEYWNKQKKVFTVRYEDLYSEPHKYLRRVLKAAGYKVTKEDIDRAVSKNPPRGGPLKHLNHYNEDDLIYIEKRLGDLMEKYNYTIRGI